MSPREVTFYIDQGKGHDDNLGTAIECVARAYRIQEAYLYELKPLKGATSNTRRYAVRWEDETQAPEAPVVLGQWERDLLGLDDEDDSNG